MLLEREVFLEALGDYASDAGSGNGRFVLVTGDSGIGKTSVVDAFRASRPDIRWLWGACDGSFTPRPLGPLQEISEQLGGTLRSTVQEDDRHRLFAAFDAELRASSGTTGIVVEDLHWADEATLDWLAYLARRVERAHVLVVVTLRDREAAAQTPQGQALARLVTHRSTRRMTLPALSPEAVRRLAGSSSHDPDRLFELTAGNPFYLVEALAARPDEVPRSVTDVVTARMVRLSSPAQRLLEGAAVLARPATADLLASVSGAPGDAIDECLTSGTLIDEGTFFRFRHELTRRAVEEAIPSFRRGELHRLALAELEQAGGDVARLAHHATAAGDSDRALRYSAMAGDEAADLASHREATSQYLRALEHAASSDRERRAELHEKVATSLSMRDRWEESLVHREAALALRRELGDRAGVSENLRGRGHCLWRLVRGEEASASIREASELMAEAPDSVEKGWALANYISFFGDRDDQRSWLT